MQRTLAIFCTAIITALLVLAPQPTAPEAVRGVLEHSQRTPETRAADYGISIVWADMPCGQDYSGCFDRAEPSEIQVRPDTSPWWINYVILHELTHVRQYREGLPVTECGADTGAIAWGALLSGYDCPGLPSREDWVR